MDAHILDTGQPATCYPVTCTRPLAACPVANRPLRDQQQAVLSAAGLTLTPAAPTGSALQLFVAGDAWIQPQDLAQLLAAAAPALLTATDGAALAWLGDSPARPTTGPTLLAAADSFAIRYPWDLLRLNELLVGALAQDDIRGEVHPQVQIDGHLALGEGSRLLPGVYIEGNVVIGRRCKIGPNCYLRGASAIGDDCHIGNAVEVKNSILLRGAAIGHLSYCGDSIIGEDANFGAGTITANFRHDGQPHRSRVGATLVGTGRRKFGAIVGDRVHTGIHTSIYPGRKLWPDVSTRPGDIVKDDLTHA